MSTRNQPATLPVRTVRRPEHATPRRRGPAAFALLLAAVATALPARAEVATLTLAEAVGRALANGPDAVIARLESERAAESLSVTRSSYMPSIGVSSSAGYSNRLNEKLRAVDENGIERRYGLTSIGSERGWLNVFLSQVLLDLRTWRELKKSELEADLAEAAEREQREAVAFATLENYLDVIRFERQHSFDLERLKKAAWLDEQARALLEAGRALPAQRELAAVRLDEVRLEERLTTEAIRRTRAELALTIGMSEADGANLELSDAGLPAVNDVPDVPDANGTALAGVPELRVLDLKQQAEEKNVEAARADRYPRLALEMGYRHFGIKRFDNYDDEFLVAVDFSLPIFDGFRTWHTIEGAGKAAEIARLRYRSMLERKRSRVGELERRLQATGEAPEVAARRERAAEQNLRLADASLQAGRGTLEEALAARAGWERAATGTIEAELDRILLWASLQRELGTLSDTLLEEASP